MSLLQGCVAPNSLRFCPTPAPPLQARPASQEELTFMGSHRVWRRADILPHLGSVTPLQDSYLRFTNEDITAQRVTCQKSSACLRGPHLPQPQAWFPLSLVQPTLHGLSTLMVTMRRTHITGQITNCEALLLQPHVPTSCLQQETPRSVCGCPKRKQEETALRGELGLLQGQRGCELSPSRARQGS